MHDYGCLIASLVSPLQFNLSDSLAINLDFLNKQSGILARSSIVAAILAFFYQHRKESRDKKEQFNERLCPSISQPHRYYLLVKISCELFLG
jgi:hypothetical protein